MATRVRRRAISLPRSDLHANGDALSPNPLIGRPVANRKQELGTGRRSRGYVAVYHYVDEIDTVFVLALRGQQEAGYARSGG